MLQPISASPGTGVVAAFAFLNSSLHQQAEIGVPSRSAVALAVGT